jgi:hypothetical protein
MTAENRSAGGALPNCQFVYRNITCNGRPNEDMATSHVSYSPKLRSDIQNSYKSSQPESVTK